MSNILQNAVYIPETNEYLVSRSRHDYITFESQGDNFFIDGGLEYLRRNFNDDVDLGFVDYTLTTQSSVQDVYDKLLWGTYGVDGRGPLKWLPIRTLETDHLFNIIKTVPQLYPLTYATIMYTLHSRLPVVTQ